MREKIKKIKAFFYRYPITVALGYFCFYFPMFTLLERYREPKFFVHCWIDDVLPFCEYFIVPYVLWFLFVPGMLLFFLYKNKADYFKCCKILFGGMTICLLIYWILPTGLMIREPIENRNIFVDVVNFIRGIDTPTNVCPSIHVSSTVGICLVMNRSKTYKELRVFRGIMMVLAILICLSTMLLDQHSLVDVICGITLSVVLCKRIEEAEETETIHRKLEWHKSRV